MGDVLKLPPLGARDDPSRPVLAVTARQLRGARGAAFRALSVLLRGHSLSRRNCHKLRVAERNAPVHSYIGIVRNVLDVPVSSSLTSEGVAAYHMEETEIVAFQDPQKRKRQALAQRRATQKRRFWKRIAAFERMAERLLEHPDITKAHPWILDRIEAVATRALVIVRQERKRLSKAVTG